MGPVTRRSASAALLLLVLLALLAGCERPRAPTLEQAEWAEFKQRFVRDGRVIDTGNEGISHSEGQGYGMLLAVAADDRDGFESMREWTFSTLQREDALLRWRYTPCSAADASCVSDDNNASDGDLLVAWALLRAHETWDRHLYRAQAQRILDAVEEQLVIQAQGYTLLLPGAEGFRHGDALTLNLSYWIFPALQAFAAQRPDGPWQALIDSGLRLIDAARFGEARLPPDWLELDAKGLRPSPRFPARYGYDAVRLPLYMHWAGLSPADDWQAFTALWQRDPVPAWVDLDNNSQAEYAWSAGMAAVASFIAPPSSGLAEKAARLAKDEPKDYYSHSLLLLTRLAAAERPQ